MEEPYFCPMSDGDCRKKGCMLWVEQADHDDEISGCALTHIAKNMRNTAKQLSGIDATLYERLGE